MQHAFFSMRYASMQGASIKIIVKEEKVMVGKATVVKTAFMASSGVIDVIDAVIMPPAKKKK